MGIGKLTVKVTAIQKWWVRPLIFMSKAAIYVGIMKDNGVDKLSSFITDHGFDFKVEK